MTCADTTRTSITEIGQRNEHHHEGLSVLPFQYPGSKALLAKRLLPHLPPHKTWVELFAGSCAMTLAKPEVAFEVLNDKDEYLYNFFRVLQDDQQAAKLYRKLMVTIDAAAQLRDSLKDLRTSKDPVQLAHAFICQYCFALGVDAGRWRHHNERYRLEAQSCPRKRWALIDSTIREFAFRIKGCKTLNWDWSRVMRYGRKWREALWWIDPPYFPTTVINHGNEYYHHILTEEDHLDLLGELRTFPAKVILFGHDCMTYNKVLPDWWKYNFHRNRKLTVWNQPTTFAEVVWSNFPLLGVQLCKR